MQERTTITEEAAERAAAIIVSTFMAFANSKFREVAGIERDILPPQSEHFPRAVKIARDIIMEQARLP